jgi:hypothetical protein
MGVYCLTSRPSCGISVLSSQRHPAPPAPEQPHIMGKQANLTRWQPRARRRVRGRTPAKPCRFCRPLCHPLPHPCRFLPRSCRFCHPERAMSGGCEPQTGLNAAFERKMPSTQNRKTAKTAMLTIPVNFAASSIPTVSPPPCCLRVASASSVVVLVSPLSSQAQAQPALDNYPGFSHNGGISLIPMPSTPRRALDMPPAHENASRRVRKASCVS